MIAASENIYEPYIRGYFDNYAIPYFIDKRQPLDDHIAVKFLRSALAAVTKGFQNADIFTYLKSGLTQIEPGQIDEIENYCIAYGIRPDDWVNENYWKSAVQPEDEFDEKQINQTRLKIIELLLKLRNSLGFNAKKWAAISSREFTTAVFDFISDTKLNEQLEYLIENADVDNQFSQADIHRQFCERFTELFSELNAAFDGHKLTAPEWNEIIFSGLAQTTFALIPPTLDQVLVGSVERSRHPDLKAVFLIGCTQKDFPTPVNYNGLISETDRLKAKSNNFELGPGLRDNLTQREYLAYIAFTRPSEMLHISFPLPEGKTIEETCSVFVTNLQSMFDNLRVEYPESKITLENAKTKSELTEYFCTQLGKEPDFYNSAHQKCLNEALEQLSCESDFCELVQQVKWAVNYDNTAILKPESAAELFANPIESSATKIETFAACPYQYFACYELKLKERKEFKLKPLDKGLFYHKAIDSLFKELDKNKRDIAKLSEKELSEFFNQQIAVFLNNDNFIKQFSEHSRHNQYIVSAACGNLERCFLAAAELIKAGIFRPKFSEKYFDDFIIKLPNGQTACILGKIDRIDTAAAEKKSLAVIFDYKLTKRYFSWSNFYYGLDLQLAIYMLAVKQSENLRQIEPIGAFYIPVETGTAKNENEFGYKAKGLFNGEFYEYIDTAADSRNSRFYNFYVSKKDKQYGNYGKSGALKTEDFEKVMTFARLKISEVLDNIAKGIIEVSPYRLNNKIPCGYCKYKALCRFDWQINNYRHFQTLNKSAVIEII